MQPAHPKRQTGKKNETEWYFIDGKWITAQERAVEISRLEAKISQIEEGFSVCEQARKSASDLTRLARDGNKLPVVVLFDIACDLVSALNSITKKQPELVIPISRAIFLWPAFIGRKRALRIENTKLIDTLQLGEGDVYSQREWRLSAPSTQAAAGLFVTAQLNKKAWDLPPLTKGNKRTWFEASWNYMLREGIVPEETTFLAQLGKSAAGKKSTTRGMSEQTEGMKRDDMRAEIKRQVICPPRSVRARRRFSRSARRRAADPRKDADGVGRSSGGPGLAASRRFA